MKIKSNSKKAAPEPVLNRNIPTVKFKGNTKRRFWQYIDNIGSIFLSALLFIILDWIVDYAYKNEIADTQSAAQQFTIQDLEAIILSFLILNLAYNVINLLLEISFDSLHWFRESSTDPTWNSFIAFKQLTAWQQWCVYLCLLSSGLIAYGLILQGIT